MKAKVKTENSKLCALISYIPRGRKDRLRLSILFRGIHGFVAVADFVLYDEMVVESMAVESLIAKLDDACLNQLKT